MPLWARPAGPFLPARKSSSTGGCRRRLGTVPCDTAGRPIKPRRRARAGRQVGAAAGLVIASRHRRNTRRRPQAAQRTVIIDTLAVDLSPLATARDNITVALYGLAGGYFSFQVIVK